MSKKTVTTPSPAMLRFGQAIRARRVALGLSKFDVAANTGLGIRTIRAYEKGERQGFPRPAYLHRLAAALQTGALELVAAALVGGAADRACEMPRMVRLRRWSEDRELASRLIVARRAGATWCEIADEIGQAGYPRPGVRAVARVFAKLAQPAQAPRVPYPDDLADEDDGLAGILARIGRPVRAVSR